MGQYASNQTGRGKDVTLRLYKAGAPLDIIEAEEITYHPNLVHIDSAPLSLGYTQHDTHVDGHDITIKAVKKGNKFLQEVLQQCRDNVQSGKAFAKYTAQISYRDVNSGLTETLKLTNATLMDLDPFNSGGTFAKSSEGFKMHGQLA